MAHLVAHVRIGRLAGLSEDVVINTFHFLTPASEAVQADYTAIAAKLLAFYNDTTPSTLSISNFLSSVVNRNDCFLVIYNMADPKPRPARYNAPFALGPVATTALPSEVAVCLSYAAGPIPGVSRGRQRGRIFLGPLATSAVATGGGVAGDVRPFGQMVTQMLAKGVQLAQGDALTVRWVVHSQADNASRLITSVSVDNAFDTMRSRGAKPTSRTVSAVAGGT